jgi:uncharacterized protein
MQAFLIDAFSFCKLGEQRGAETEISSFPRLSAECADAGKKQGHLTWLVQGEMDKYGRPRLTLTVQGEIELLCQRCLTPISFHLDANAELILAKDEDHADEIEAMLDDEEMDAVDVVVGSKSFNLLDLVEDEALLAIPQSPKHAVCPEMVDAKRSAMSAEAAIEAEASKSISPFAVLKK